MTTFRGLTAQQIAATASSSGALAWLLSLDFLSGTRYYTDVAGDLTFNGHTWLAGAGLLAVGDPSESADLRAAQLTITLTGVDTTVIGLLQTDKWYGRDAMLYRAYLDPTTNGLAAGVAPFALWVGRMIGGWTVKEDRTDGPGPGTCTVQGALTGSLAVFDETRGVLCNPSSHGAIAPGDLFFSQAAKLSGKKLVWQPLPAYA